MADAVRIEGLRDLQRDLKHLEPAARREVTRSLKQGAEVVARAAGPLTASRTGTLAGGFRASASMMRATVRSPVPYAGVQEVGGVIRPKGSPVRIKAHPAATLALERNEERIVDALGDAVMDAAARLGWR